MTVINIQVPLTKSLLKELAREIHDLNVIEQEKSKEEFKKDLPKSTPEKLYTVREIEEDYNINPFLITRHIRKGLLVASKVGKSWRISQSNLNKYLQIND